MRLWVTGFEPFQGVPENPSALAVAALPASLDGHDIHRRILSVDTVVVETELVAIYETAPDVVLHVGVAESRDAIGVERIAVNRRCFRIPDNAGCSMDGPVEPGAPDHLEARVPVEDIVTALAAEGLPAEASDSAGMFLCNQVMFRSLRALGPNVKTGFLHVPAHPTLARTLGREGLGVDRIRDAILIALRTIVTMLVVLIAAPAGAAKAGETEWPYMKGMTVSCPGYGQIWGAPPMIESLEQLSKLGVEWVAIHPYAGVRRDGSIRWEPAERTGYLPRAVTIAKNAKMHLFWKPHLAYWGSFEWRGAIDFGDDERAWARFFEQYHLFIMDQARFAQRAKAPMFAVGIEYAKTMRFEKQWRKIIADVRRVYSGKITYAANWDDYDRVPFWDALDAIGVQAYFPLGDESPTREKVEKAWDGHLKQLLALSDRHGKKPIVLTEIGYPSGPEAASAPWKPAVDRSAHMRAMRAMLMDVTLKRLAREPRIRGMFWWKWLPGRALFDRDFSMKDEEAKRVLDRHW